MSFSATGGRILIRDDNGDIVFDTDERLLVFTDYVAGQVVIPQRQASSFQSARVDVNVNQENALASINAAATVVFGAFKTTHPGFEGQTQGGWFQATGTQCLARFTMTGNLTSELNGIRARISGSALYTFRASGGQLLFHQRTWIRTTFNTSTSQNLTYTIPQTTIDYKLFCGTFV